jgi:hypothetical protein
MYTFGANLYKKAQTAKKKYFHGRLSLNPNMGFLPF